MIDLTKITTPVGLLDEVHGPGTLRALQDHGGPYQRYERGEWIDDAIGVDPTLWVRDCVRRVKPVPRTKPSIDWSPIAPKFKWLAQDQDGAAYAYAIQRPEIRDTAWSNGGNHRRIDGFLASYTPGTCLWRDSLVERPEGAK